MNRQNQSRDMMMLHFPRLIFTVAPLQPEAFNNTFSYSFFSLRSDVMFKSVRPLSVFCKQSIDIFNMNESKNSQQSLGMYSDLLLDKMQSTTGHDVQIGRAHV